MINATEELETVPFLLGPLLCLNLNQVRSLESKTLCRTGNASQEKETGAGSTCGYPEK